MLPAAPPPLAPPDSPDAPPLVPLAPALPPLLPADPLAAADCDPDAPLEPWKMLSFWLGAPPPDEPVLESGLLAPC